VFSHTFIGVNNFERALSFYTALSGGWVCAVWCRVAADVDYGFDGGFVAGSDTKNL